MGRSFLLSLAVFVGLILLTWVISGGRFVFGLFVLPLGLIPLLFSRRKQK
ncbi:MAG TPA: hypothetical protein GXX29_09805 [Firmicutes bacterium]|nr:hypothetical protein [Bacillota bacterium]